MTQTIADTLDKAAELLETKGWAQGNYEIYRSTGFCYCVLGAVFAAASREEVGAIDDRIGERAADALGFADSGDVVAWNDAPDRTADEVIAKLREAASKARDQVK